MGPQHLLSEGVEGGSQGCVRGQGIPLCDGAGEEAEFSIIRAAGDALELSGVLLPCLVSSRAGW